MEDTVQQVTTPAPATDFVQLVKDAVKSQGLSSFVRVTLPEDITQEGLDAVTDEYIEDGYEIFANGSTVVMLKN